ncbi:DUF7455 domain-containing protein [Branchiibius hedensis]|nr:hypothetical protein [Branchiibius hedensis]
MSDSTAPVEVSVMDDINRRCDQCGAPSEVVVSNQRLDMAFCGHHYRAQATALADEGFFPVEQTVAPPEKPTKLATDSPAPAPVPAAMLTRLTRQSSPGVFEETLTNADGRLTNAGGGHGQPALLVYRMVGGRRVVLESRSFVDGVLTDDGDLPAIVTYDMRGRPFQVLRFRAGLLSDALNDDGTVRGFAVVRMDTDGEVEHVESWRDGVRQAGPNR